jgi:soluble lytic murein transglycosylase-like protein
MIRLTHLSGSQRGTVATSPKAVVRIGRGADCDVRFDPNLDTRVSSHHAEIRFSDGHYVVIDAGSANGTLVNGRMIRSQRLKSGDRIGFGGGGGPEVKFEIDGSFGGLVNGLRRHSVPLPAAAEDVAQEAQRKVAQARAMSAGQPSGQTMFIVADALKQVEQVTTKKGASRTRRIVVSVLAVAAVGFAVMGYVIWDQRQQIERIAHRKEALDREIAKINAAMQIETDPERLQELEARLTLLTGKAEQTIGEMAKKDKDEAQKLAESGGDDLDREIRRILRKFEADTYAIPAIFKERLRHHIDLKVRNAAATRTIYARKKQYWPMIVREFSALGLPEEIAFVAWQESSFDPLATSPAGARGMWQFMDFQARRYGLHVAENWRRGGHDERIDPLKETKIAARYLHDLLSEFGADSFMLAIASYNKGENGVRRVLHEVGFRREQRDFWHLYRLKKLPEETMEYVPQILAAAIVCNDPKKYGLE